MNGLERTFQFLETAPQDPVLEVLRPALRTHQAVVRRRALETIVRRDEPEGYELVIDLWDQFDGEARARLADAPAGLAAALQTVLEGQDDARLLRALEMMVTLRSFGLVPAVIDVAESYASQPVRVLAQRTVFDLASEIGAEARQDRDRPLVRRPLQRALATSVLRYPVHQQDRLVDALLSCCGPNDSELLTLLAPGTDTREVLLRRLATSREAAVTELLAAMVHRQRLCSELEERIAERSDAVFARQLLASIGDKFSGHTRRNLALMGLPRCFQPEHLEPQTLSRHDRLTLALVYAVSDRDSVRALTRLLDALESLDQDASELAGPLMQTLLRFPVLDKDLLLRAAASPGLAAAERAAQVAEPAAEPAAQVAERVAQVAERAVQVEEPAVRLLRRAIHALAEDRSPYAKPLRRIFSPLSAAAVMGQWDELRMATRRRIGRVVLQIDPQAIATVTDRLRHPVLGRRLEGILAAVALEVVDDVCEPLLRMVANDHLEARVRALDALKFATDESSYRLLLQLSEGPVGAIRDAALEALQHRNEARA
ncbi:hypothetical protein [Roseimaritima sediminicola]|uniref:hypothetical protein n=1 Tax=Roseimaritima sediminicola TaxID=2662066 RepID=UPI0012984533|nr:hypothetical protein [Roseimaritima sediminicola]